MASEASSIQDVLTDAGGEELSAFVYRGDYMEIMRFLGIPPTVILNLAAVFGCCLGITFIFIRSPTVTLLVSLSVLLVDVFLFGLMAMTDIALNEASIVTLVMACGFAVDYTSHVGLSFMTFTGTGHERAVAAIAHSGRAISNAGMTTLLAAIALAFGGPIFQVFAIMFAGIVVIGLYHALVILPIALSHVPEITTGPPSDAEPEKPGWTFTFRRVAVVVLSLAAIGMFVPATVSTYVRFTGETIFDSSVYVWQVDFGPDGSSAGWAQCTNPTCEGATQGLTEITPPALPIYEALNDAPASTMIPLGAAGIAAGTAAAVWHWTRWRKTGREEALSAHSGPTALRNGPLFLAVLAAALCFGGALAYQVRLWGYENNEVTFFSLGSFVIEEDSAKPRRKAGFMSIFGSFACYVFISVLIWLDAPTESPSGVVLNAYEMGVELDAPAPPPLRHFVDKHEPGTEVTAL